MPPRSPQSRRDRDGDLHGAGITQHQVLGSGWRARVWVLASFNYWQIWGNFINFLNFDVPICSVGIIMTIMSTGWVMAGF